MGTGVTPALDLARVLTTPAAAGTLDDARWTGMLSVARAERLLATLGERLAATALPAPVARILAAARADADQGQVHARWEVDRAHAAIAPLGIPMILLKGSAFVAAGLAAAAGRIVGDLDILVPRSALDDVEAALRRAGWDWVKPDDYDDHYYRTWMHELPPLIHRDRDRMIDVHHTILPLTARPTPKADALIAASVALPDGTRVLSPADMIVHAAAHLIADGDLAGGMRNLWDIDRLARQFDSAAFRAELAARATLHELGTQIARALRLSHALFATPLGDPSLTASDRLFLRAITARDGWGRLRRPLTRQAFYVRSHWQRMPPTLLARHLWTKWRRAR